MINLVCVGDEASLQDDFLKELVGADKCSYSSTFFNGSFELNLNTIYYEILSIKKLEDFQARSISIYEQCDAILFFFSIYIEDSLDALEDYVEECAIFKGQTPMFLIGLDLNVDSSYYKTISFWKIENLQKKLGASKYFYCTKKKADNGKSILKYIFSFSLGGLVSLKFDLEKCEKIIQYKSGGLMFNLYIDGHAEIIEATGKNVKEIPVSITHKGLTYNVTHIGINQEFKWPCSEMTFPENSHVIHIGKINLQHLCTFSIPSFLSTLHPNIFAHTRHLTKIVKPCYKVARNFIFRDEKFLINNDRIIIFVPRNASKRLFVRQDIKAIGPYAFAYIQQAICVQFSVDSHIRYFGEYAFAEANITVIDIPKSVKSIGDYCFKNCVNLQFLTCQYYCELTEFPDNCFHGCKNIKKILISNNFKSLSKTLINNLPEKISFTFLLPNNNFKIIKGTVFSLDQKSLISRNDDEPSNTLIIPSTVTEIYRKSLINSTSLTTIIFSQRCQIKAVAINIFPSSLVRLVLSPSVEQIHGAGEHNDLRKLKYVVVTNPNHIVFGCSSLDNWDESSKIYLIGSPTCEFDTVSIYQTHHRPIVYVKNLSDFISKTNDEDLMKYPKVFNPDEEEEVFEPEINDMDDEEELGRKAEKPVSEYIIDFSAFQTIMVIGHGSFGTVYLMHRAEDDLYCAVKHIGNDCDDNDNKYFKREVEVMCSACHPCIAKIIGYKLYDSDEDPNKIAIEFYEKKSLYEVMNKLFRDIEIPGFGDTQMAIIMLGVAMGMRYLHSINIMHRDIKPSNIFLTEEYHPKIGDFGISKFIDISLSNTRNMMTPLYAAPEQVEDKPYNNKIDVYSYGLILLELVNKKPSYKRCCGPIIREKPQDYALVHTKNLINDCLNKDPNARPSFDDIVNIIKNNGFKLFGNEDTAKVNEYYQKILLLRRRSDAS